MERVGSGMHQGTLPKFDTAWKSNLVQRTALVCAPGFCSATCGKVSVPPQIRIGTEQRAALMSSGALKWLGFTLTVMILALYNRDSFTIETQQHGCCMRHCAAISVKAKDHPGSGGANQMVWIQQPKDRHCILARIEQPLTLWTNSKMDHLLLCCETCCNLMLTRAQTCRHLAMNLSKAALQASPPVHI